MAIQALAQLSAADGAATARQSASVKAKALPVARAFITVAVLLLSEQARALDNGLAA